MRRIAIVAMFTLLAGIGTCQAQVEPLKLGSPLALWAKSYVNKWDAEAVAQEMDKDSDGGTLLFHLNPNCREAYLGVILEEVVAQYGIFSVVRARDRNGDIAYVVTSRPVYEFDQEM